MSHTKSLGLAVLLFVLGSIALVLIGNAIFFGDPFAGFKPNPNPPTDIRQGDVVEPRGMLAAEYNPEDASNLTLYFGYFVKVNSDEIYDTFNFEPRPGIHDPEQVSIEAVRNRRLDEWSLITIRPLYASNVIF
jgi:hypothetical protein